MLHVKLEIISKPYLILRKCGVKGTSELDCVAIGSRLRGAMGTRPPAKFWPQLWATIVRNILLKKRDTRKTLAVSYQHILRIQYYY